ncbi:MAG TPA: IS110 family transposase [Armatimonadota bacterium]|nr:IS110 family transposase [Armatimonadota bacterium]
MPAFDAMPVVHPRAAGIDIGSRSHFVAVPDDHPTEGAVREFGAYTPDLCALADWLHARGVTTVALEATGVYWIPLFHLLEERGFAVIVVNPRTAKHVPGRKTDVLDCQWLRKLHTFGLLEASFRLPLDLESLRACWRQRTTLVRLAADDIRRVQKALDQMNLHLHHAVSDITGVSGLTILRAIAQGETDPTQLAAHAETRLKCSREDLIKALTGQYRPEHVFAMRQALERYDFYATQLAACEAEVETLLQALAPARSQAPVASEASRPRRRQPKSKGEPAFDLQDDLTRLYGVDLTAIQGLGSLHLMTILSEVGTDLTKWPSEKHFASWLGLAPNHKITGGKILGRQTRHVVNRGAEALRMAAFSLSHSHSALGAYYRRMKAQLGAPKAITAVAHKLAVLVYRLVTQGREYVDIGQAACEHRYEDRRRKALQKQAATLGFDLVPRTT